MGTSKVCNSYESANEENVEKDDEPAKNGRAAMVSTELEKHDNKGVYCGKESVVKRMSHKIRPILTNCSSKDAFDCAIGSRGLSGKAHDLVKTR